LENSLCQLMNNRRDSERLRPHLLKFAWLTASCLILSSHSAAAQAPAKPADAEAIAALIAQLGDEDFQKRQDATRTLDAIGRPALAAL
jgi:hypothetical protein